MSQLAVHHAYSEAVVIRELVNVSDVIIVPIEEEGPDGEEYLDVSVYCLQEDVKIVGKLLGIAEAAVLMGGRIRVFSLTIPNTRSDFEEEVLRKLGIYIDELVELQEPDGNRPEYLQEEE